MNYVAMNESQVNHTLNISVAVDKRPLSLVVVESCLFLVLDVLALIGNSFVCLAVYSKQSLRTTINILIFSLALTDLLTALLVLPLGTISSFADRWMFGPVGCQVYRFVGYYLVGVSLSVLTLISVERCTRVSKPNLYRKVFSKRSVVVMNVLIWLSTCGLVWLVFPLIGVKFQLSSSNPTLCLTVFDNEVASLFFNSIHTAYFLLPSMVIAWCYTKTYLAVREYNAIVTPVIQPVFPSHTVTPSMQETSSEDMVTRHLHSNKPPTKLQYIFKKGSTVTRASSSQSGNSRHAFSFSPQGHNSNRAFEETKLLKMLAVVLAGFYICWFPGFVFGILQIAKPIGSDALQYLNLYYYFPAYTASMINPIIYAVMSQKFRAAFHQLVCRK